MTLIANRVNVMYRERLFVVGARLALPFFLCHGFFIRLPFSFSPVT